jgi:hypothetical protein
MIGRILTTVSMQQDNWITPAIYYGVTLILSPAKTIVAQTCCVVTFEFRNIFA